MFYREMLRAAERLGRPLRLVVPAETDRIEERGHWTKIFILQPRHLGLAPVIG